jgi:hypothetical protein
MKRAFAILAWAALAACAEPGKELVPVEGDFAFLEITLQG